MRHRTVGIEQAEHAKEASDAGLVGRQWQIAAIRKPQCAVLRPIICGFSFKFAERGETATEAAGGASCGRHGVQQWTDFVHALSARRAGHLNL